MDKIDMKHRPSAEYRYWLYDPEGDGMVYFRSAAERDKRASAVIESYLDEEWAEEVELVAAGELTHFAQLIDRQLRPADEEGVFKGAAGLAGLLNADEFWEQQPYGTRLYYGVGIADYLHRDVLRAAARRCADIGG